MRKLLAAALAASLSFAVVHCSSSSNGVADDGDGGNANGCPASAPTAGTDCTVASNVVCQNYPTAGTPGCECCGGGSTAFQCVNGKWSAIETASGSGGTQAACPATVPNEGDPCTSTPCGAQPACQYDCATGGGSYSTATCNGTWHVSKLAIACQVDDGGGGVDARGDAPTDAPRDAPDGG